MRAVLCWYGCLPSPKFPIPSQFTAKTRIQRLEKVSAVTMLCKMQIFFPCGHPTAYMSFCLIDFQNLSRLARQQRIDTTQSFRDILVNRTLTDSKLLGSFPYRRIVLNDVIRHFYGTFLDLFMLIEIIAVHILLQGFLFLHCMSLVIVYDEEP